jgi:RNA polymerase sigma factor (sigma-70 family)
MDDNTQQPSFEQYRSLVPWIAISRFGQLYGKTVGCVSFDDLLQEGYVALLNALRTYDREHGSEAAFSTYSYFAIHKAMSHYLESNSAPVTGGRAFNARRGGEELQAKFAMAAKRILLSDLNFDEWEAAIVDRTSPEEIVDEQDWEEHCINRLVEKMEPDELSLLVMRSLGASQKEIGDVLGISRRHAGRLVRQKLLKASGILDGEE